MQKKTPTQQQLKNAIRPIVEQILNESSSAALPRSVMKLLYQLQSAMATEYGDKIESLYFKRIHLPLQSALESFVAENTKK